MIGAQAYSQLAEGSRAGVRLMMNLRSQVSIGLLWQRLACSPGERSEASKHQLT